jgi:hypothetical protein
MMRIAPPPVTVVVPTRRGWADCRDAVESLVGPVAVVGGELLLATTKLITAPVPESVRVVVTGGDDVFVARAGAVAAANGEIVVILEDHLVVDRTFIRALLDAWSQQPHAYALVHTVRDGSHGVLDRAGFLLTLGPFVPPLDAPPIDRTPIPGTISYRRDVLPRSPPPVGWLEYQLPLDLARAGRMGVAPGVHVVHVQNVGLRQLSLHFHSGRTFAASTASDTGADLCRVAADAARAWRLLWRQTRGHSRRTSSEPATVWVMVAALCAANVTGQVVGRLTGAGNSAAALE